ncbi:MAG: response regulator [Calditrichaeota bacterium]|nr:MAG: response regulator [Calditrichota bacterium]
MSEIGLFIGNLMDRTRIRDHLKQQGYQVTALSTMEELVEFLQSHPQGLIIADLVDLEKKVELNHPAVKTAGQRILGFFPHVRTDVLDKMKKAGIDHCYPRSKFFADFDQLFSQFS